MADSAQVLADAEARLGVSPAALALRRFMRNRAAVLGLLMVLGLALYAFGVPMFSEYPATNLKVTSKLPFQVAGYPLGTDIAGRDMLVYLALGMRTSITIATLVQLFVIVVSLVLGFIAGWFGGAADFAISRLAEVWVALPGLLFQILFIVVFGPTVLNLVLSIALLGWPETTRIVRARVLQVRHLDYIDASRGLGAPTFMIAVKHVIPNLLNPFVIAISLGVPSVILSESTLSFLGYGLSESQPSLGKLVGISWQYIQAYWHMAVLPALFLSLLMLGASFFGDGLRDALDPQSS